MNDNKKLATLGWIAKKAGIKDYIIRDWFFGQRELEVNELNEVIPALEEAETRARHLKVRAERDLLKKLNK